MLYNDITLLIQRSGSRSFGRKLDSEKIEDAEVSAVAVAPMDDDTASSVFAVAAAAMIAPARAV